MTLQSGALRSLTAISYDGFTYQEIAPLTVRREWDRCFVEIAMPVINDPPVESGVVYDYYFLLLEPMTGDPVLDLVCHEIDLDTGQVVSRVYHRAEILERKELEDSAKKTMLTAYANLFLDLSEIPAL